MSKLGYYFNNHVLYSLLCRISIKAFGETELTARLPALLLGMSCIFSLFIVGKHLFDEQSGLLASFLLAISAFHIDHSSEARGYAGISALLASFVLSVSQGAANKQPCNMGDIYRIYRSGFLLTCFHDFDYRCTNIYIRFYSTVKNMRLHLSLRR
ncbi:MAG: glycosyltransferase family 39 protein [Desulfosudis oleivorans]|nr:glycosyltransferase family 39 protein [Desulfosudis oleivorans]